MRTISTKFIAATDTKSKRVKATVCEGTQSVTLLYDHALNADRNHMAAAIALMEKLGWQDRMLGGHTDDGMVFVVDSSLSRLMYMVG